MSNIALPTSLANHLFGSRSILMVKKAIGVFMVLFVAMLLGVMIATENYLLLAVLLSLPMLLAMLRWPEMSLSVTMIGVVLIPGVIELYLPQLVLIRWIFPILALVASISIVIKYYFLCRNDRIGSSGKNIMLFAMLFFMSSMLSSLVSSGISINTVSGMKGYLQTWPFIFGLGFMLINKNNVSERLYKLALIIGLIQIPVALHQFLFIVPMRMTTKLAEAGVVAIDVVAGTFGAMLWGGGRSTTLGLFQTLVITLVLLRYKDGLLSKWKTIILISMLLVPVLISEIKVFPFFLIVMAGVLYRDYIWKFPFRALGYASGLISVCLLLFMANFFLPSTKGQQAATLSAYIDDAVSYNLGSKGYGNSVLNRSTVYPFWVKENIGQGDLLHTLIGYGAGATNSTASVDVQNGPLKAYAGYTIGLTSVSALLWESGIIGTGAVLGMFILAIRRVYQLSLSVRDSGIRRITNFLLVGFSILLISLFHVNYFAFDLSYQTIMSVMLGIFIWLERINAAE